MKFNDALELLKAGVHVVRQSWDVNNGYLVYMPRMTHVWRILTVPAANAGNHIFSVEELEADDWVTLAEKDNGQQPVEVLAEQVAA